MCLLGMSTGGGSRPAFACFSPDVAERRSCARGGRAEWAWSTSSRAGPTGSSGEGSQHLPAFSPMKGGRGEGGGEGGEGGHGGSGHRSPGSGSPPKPRASPTQFDRNRDIRDPKDVYRMTGIFDQIIPINDINI